MLTDICRQRATVKCKHTNSVKWFSSFRNHSERSVPHTPHSPIHTHFDRRHTVYHKHPNKTLGKIAGEAGVTVMLTIFLPGTWSWIKHQVNDNFEAEFDKQVSPRQEGFMSCQMWNDSPVVHYKSKVSTSDHLQSRGVHFDWLPLHDTSFEWLSNDTSNFTEWGNIFLLQHVWYCWNSK